MKITYAYEEYRGRVLHIDSVDDYQSLMAALIVCRHNTGDLDLNRYCGALMTSLEHPEVVDK